MRIRASVICGWIDRPQIDVRSSQPAAETPVLKTRIIPCLDVKDGRVVKGVQFVGSARRRRPGRGGDRL